MRRRRRSQNPILLIVALIATLFYVLNTSDVPDTADAFTGKCVGISDGDTIKVLHNGKEERVRLYGIDSPEKGQPYGTVARKFTGDTAFGKTVTVQVKSKDRYGRTVGWVTLPSGRVLNIELLLAGLAWWYRAYSPNDRELEQAEAYARKNKLGLWKDADPVPPWDFRRKK